jgi:hypothetical protein
MFGRGRSFLQNFNKLPVPQRKAFADNARKKLEEMPTPNQPLWDKLNRAVPVSEIISEYIISFTRNFLITIARKLGAVHGTRSAENLMDKVGKKEQPAEAGPSKPGTSKQENVVPKDAVELRTRQEAMICLLMPANDRAADEVEVDSSEEEGSSYEEEIEICLKDRNRAKLLEHFFGLGLEGYSMLDLTKLAENEFRVYQDSRQKFSAYMLKFDDELMNSDDDSE